MQGFHLRFKNKQFTKCWLFSKKSLPDISMFVDQFAMIIDNKITARIVNKIR
jgi:hypothetical protein